jgi:hypothetical protein
MGPTNSILDSTNALTAGVPHTVIAAAYWPIFIWFTAVVTSSVAGVLINQFIERRKNRVRLFKMEKVDYHNIHAAPAEHRGQNYQSVRCATYRLKNTSNMDYREVVLHMGFRAGKIIHAAPRSDLMGEDHFKMDFSRPNQITITFPIFNREDVVDLKIEAADCDDIELIWKYVGSHTGVQIILPELQAGQGGAMSLRSAVGSSSRLEVQKIGNSQKFRAWLAKKIHPGLGLF